MVQQNDACHDSSMPNGLSFTRETPLLPLHREDRALHPPYNQMGQSLLLVMYILVERWQRILPFQVFHDVHHHWRS